MKRILTFLFAATLLAVGAVAQELTTDLEKASYSVGVQMGKAIEPGKDSLDLEVLIRGLQDVIAGKKLQLEDAECQKNFQIWQQQAREAQSKVQSAEGEAFLAANAKREGVTVLPSGLQYEVLKKGTGEMPKSTDTIKAHYTGTLIDGTKFDSSLDRGEPIEARVTGLIPGWTEALQLMRVGDKWKLFIPQNLAYGARGAGAQIPPYSALVFEMELVEIVKKP
jgi:FKBP-type peptidyl-prolyl cis-trans isomerase FklB